MLEVNVHGFVLANKFLSHSHQTETIGFLVRHLQIRSLEDLRNIENTKNELGTAIKVMNLIGISY